MQTLQRTTHVENNGQVKLTLPPEYANQEVELVVIIQTKEPVTNINHEIDKLLQSKG